MNELVDGILRGDKLAVGRGISLVENDSSFARSLLQILQKKVGKGFRIGVTGPIGVGKSTLIDALVPFIRSKGKTVGIVAIDPTSPFTGGAMLGDRIRMTGLSGDDGVFIRSMATRGHFGGISKATHEAVDILDASGKDFIFIETIGVGQADIEIAQLADCVILIFCPESGDSIQAMKSGFLEVADLIAVNKSDKPGAEGLKYELQGVFGLYARNKSPAIFLTDALSTKGVEELVLGIERFIKEQDSKGELTRRRRRNITVRIINLAHSIIQDKIYKFDKHLNVDTLVSEVIKGKTSIYEAADILAQDLTRL